MVVEPRSEDKPATVAQRVAGGLMILNAGLFFVSGSLGASSARMFQATNMGGQVGAIVDLALGALLAAGRAEILWLVLARLLLSPVIRAMWKGVPDVDHVAMQLLLAASLLALLLGDAGKGRLIGGCLLFAVYLTIGALAPF